MSEDRANQPEGNDRHHHEGPRPACKDPGKAQIDPHQRQQHRHRRPAKELPFLLGLPGIARLHPEILLDPGHEILPDRGLDLRRAGWVILGQVARHRHHPQAVLAHHRRKPRRPFHGHDIGQRHITRRAIGPRRAHLRPFQEIRRQFTLGQFHPDRRGTRSIREGRRLDPAQHVAQVGGQPVDGKSHGLPGRRQAQDKFLLVIGQRILQPRHFGKHRQPRLQRLCRRLQDRRIRPIEIDRDRRSARPEPAAAKAQLLQQRMSPDFGLHGGDEGGAGIGPQVWIDDLHRNPAQEIGILRRGPRKPAPGAAAHLGHDEFHRVQPMLGLIGRAHCRNRPLQLGHHRLGIGARRPRQHREIPGQRGLLRRVEKAELHIPAQEQRRLRGQRQHGGRQHRIARRDHPAHQWLHPRFLEAVQLPVHEPARRVIPFLLHRIRQRMGHVIGQDQEALDQRGQHHRHDGKGNVLDQVPEPPADGRQRQKGDHRRDRRCHDRPCHAHRGPLRRHDRGFPQMPHAEIGMFPHDDGIVHDHAQHQDQREKRDHVDRQTAGPHHEDGGKGRHRNACRHPKRDAPVQEQEQHQHHQHQPRRRIVEHQRQPLGDLLRPRPHQIKCHALRQGGPHRSRNLGHAGLHVDGIALGAALHPDRHGRVLAHKGRAPPIRAVHPHAGHVADAQHRTVSRHPQGDIADLVRASPLFAGPHPGGPRRHFPRGRSHDRRRDGIGNLGHGHVMPHQRDRGHLDNGLRRRQSVDRGPRHPRRKKPRGEFVGQPRQLIHAHRPGDHHIRHLIAPGAAPHLGFLGIGGQGRHALDRRRHILRGPIQINPRLELDLDRGPPLEGSRIRRRHALDGNQRGFQNLHDGAVHILGPGAGPGHIDIHFRYDHIREILRPDIARRRQPRHQHHHHHQVGDGPMPHEIGQYPP